MILGRKLGQTDFTGPVPELPTTWAYEAHCLTSSGLENWTFTAPEKGWYQFYLIGPGGSGGSITGSCDARDWYVSFPPTGGGGGGGGYAIHQAYLKKGETVACQLSAAEVSAVFKDTTAVAAAGKAGGNATSKAGGTGGAGGAANGANTLNLNGGTGNAGEKGKTIYIETEGTTVGSSWSERGNDGGTGGRIYGQKYYGKAEGSVKAVLGPGGSGAGRWYADYTNPSGEGSASLSGVGARPSPQGGSPGGVIVEAAAG